MVSSIVKTEEQDSYVTVHDYLQFLQRTGNYVCN